jgi:hypothetical protein
MNNDIIGKKFGRLLVLNRAEQHSKRRDYYFNCLCDCGKSHKVLRYHLTLNKISSCGCLRKETAAKNSNKKPLGVSMINTLYGRYKAGAKVRNLEFNLSNEEFKSFIFSNCKYCGVAPMIFYKTKTANGGVTYNGIDRIDNTLNYTISNCVTCCKDCNYAKGSMSLDEWYLYIKRLIKFNEGDK